jgi:hypothetical protein
MGSSREVGGGLDRGRLGKITALISLSLWKPVSWIFLSLEGRGLR